MDIKNEPTDFVRNTMTESNRKVLDRIMNGILFGFIFVNCIIYVVLKSIPSPMVQSLFSSEFAQLFFPKLRLDYDYFEMSGNSMVSRRIWVTEFAISVQLLIFATISIAVVATMFWQHKFDTNRLTFVDWYSTSYAASALIIVIISSLLICGFSKYMILDHFRVSFGATDISIIWFSVQLWLILAAFWGILFYSIVFLSKMSSYFKNIGT